MTVRKKSRCGFSILEILFITAAAVVLFAVLFPVYIQYTKRHERGNPTCLSQLKNLGTAMLMYVQDYDETFPNRSWNGGGGACFDTARLQNYPGEKGQVCSQNAWTVQIFPYHRNANALLCPEDRDGKTRNILGEQGAVNVKSPLPTSYGINTEVYRYPKSDLPPGETGSILKAADMEQTENIYLLADSSNLTFDSRTMDRVRLANLHENAAMKTGCKADKPIESPTLAASPRMNQPKHYRHNEGSFITYADGHVRWSKSDTISCRRGGKNLQGPNPR